MELPLIAFPERESINRLRVLYGEDVDEDVIDFWRRILVSLCIHRHSVTIKLDVNELERIFTIKGIPSPIIIICIIYSHISLYTL
jgi:hypothetical protein